VNPVRVLVTRPAADGERTAAKLRASGFDVLIAPLLRMEALAAEFGAGPWSGVAMTSANAAAALEQHPRRTELLSLPVFVVGRRTADAVRSAGFDSITSADGNEADLVRLIAARPRAAAPLLYLAGKDRAGDLAGDLAAHGIVVRTVEVYRAAKATRFPADAQAALQAGRIDGVLHYSRRSAEVYIDCAKAGGILDMALAPFQYCLSRQVAEPLRAAGARKMRVAPKPEEAALIDLVAS
jgi:uroporphyrinogen-III synthase